MKRIRRKWKGQFKHRKNMKRYGLGRKGEGQGKKLKNKRTAVREIFYPSIHVEVDYTYSCCIPISGSSYCMHICTVAPADLVTKAYIQISPPPPHVCMLMTGFAHILRKWQIKCRTSHGRDMSAGVLGYFLACHHGALKNMREKPARGNFKCSTVRKLYSK